jgi:predicted nuclease of predicted toxin-antitoxin system
VNVKLLLDENISPKVAHVLCRDGIDACGVRDRGLLEATDPEVFAKAFAEDRVVVTVNVGDFQRLASRCDLHAGVVLIERGDLLRDEQIDVIRDAVAAMIRREDMVNTLLRVALDGTMSFEILPSPS